tara:strand:- start:10062 stop:10382 length:321 start_codon:yes stop_codon:yes gene_type:complete
MCGTQTVVRAFTSSLAVILLALTVPAQEGGLPAAWHAVSHGEMHNTGKSGKKAKVPVVFESNVAVVRVDDLHCSPDFDTQTCCTMATCAALGCTLTPCALPVTLAT